MTGAPPDRVRVTGPPRRRTPAPRTTEIDSETRLGGIYMGSLLREQLRLALGVLALLGADRRLAAAGLPPVAGPRRGATSLGVPLPWWLLGVLVYPTLLALGWVYVRRAERNERDFAELVRLDRSRSS